jgi:uncharacterized protein YbaP (TraB family)
MKYILSTLLCLLLPLLANADSQPATYTVQGKHNVLHLVGTVHLLQDSEVLPSNITRGYADAKQLLLEIDTTAMDPMSTQQTMLSLGMLDEDESLETKLDAATYSKLKAAAQAAGLDMMIADHMRPWLVALTLEETMFAKMGFNPNSGVEMQLTKRAAQDHKAIAGLETMDEQLNFFANLDEKTELEYLTSTLDELKDLRKEMDELMNAWRQGDEGKLAALMQKEFRGHEKFYSILLTERNKRWIGKLQSLLDNSNDNYLVAVGALHLVGNDGVVSLLRRAGYKITRD